MSSADIGIVLPVEEMQVHREPEKSWLTAKNVALIALVVMGALVAAGIGFGLPVLTGIGIAGFVFTAAYGGSELVGRLFDWLYPFNSSKT